MVRYVVAAVAFAFVASSSTARADEGIALEVHTGTRSPDADRLLKPILEELATNKISTGAAIAVPINSISLPAIDTANPLPPNFPALVDQGQKLFFTGNFEAAIGQLTPLIESAHKNAAAIAQDQSLLESVRRAYIVVALAQSRRGDSGAMTETFKELARAFPAMKIDKVTYGPDAVTYFNQAHQDVMASGMGKLHVKIDGMAGTVFVDEQFRAPGATTVEVTAGDHRVLVLTPNGQSSRTHRVTVKGGGEATVTIDTSLDQALHVEGWTGFDFANAQDREQHESIYAAKLANQVGARSVVIIGIDEQKGRKVIVGSLISLENGREIRRAQVAMVPEPSTSQKKGLAEFLISGSASPGVEQVQVSDKQVDVASLEQTPSVQGSSGPTLTRDRRWSGWQWISLTATVGLAGAGGALFYLDGKCKGEMPVGHPCNEVYHNEPAAAVVLISAAPVAALTIYLMVTQKEQVPSNIAWIAPLDHGAVAGYTMTW